MVLATKVGQKRGFGLGLVLTIVTFGIYAVYWNYRAHNELYRQFELDKESRDEGMVWYVLGLVLPPFLLAYLWVFASNIAYLRERVGLRRATTPGRVVGLVGLGLGAFATGLILLDIAATASGGDAAKQASAAVDSAGTIFLVLSGVAAILLAIAYFGLQRDINELWDAYEARMWYLNMHPEEARRVGPAQIPLPDSAIQAPAALRAEIDALRARHPTLRALPQLETLAARAEAGEDDASAEASRLLRDIAALLVERADLLRAGAPSERLELVEAALF